MRGVFDDEELKPAPVRRDTELTLGSGTLLAIFFGLVLLCGLCFGLGYTMGHHGSQPSLEKAQPAAGSSPLQPANSVAKPLATEQVPQAPAAASADAGQQPAATTSDTSPSAPAATQPAPAQAAAAPSQPSVHPVLAPAVATTQPPLPVANLNQHPASAPVTSSPQTGGLMVQIAAVSNAEDADVLTNALRRRGYTVTAHRDPADNLIHVRIGPFATVAEANSWKMKLLNDGYNAIVQP
jgi:cell division septation protein DedD